MTQETKNGKDAEFFYVLKLKNWKWPSRAGGILAVLFILLQLPFVRKAYTPFINSPRDLLHESSRGLGALTDLFPNYGFWMVFQGLFSVALAIVFFYCYRGLTNSKKEQGYWLVDFCYQKRPDEPKWKYWLSNTSYALAAILGIAEVIAIGSKSYDAGRVLHLFTWVLFAILGLQIVYILFKKLTIVYKKWFRAFVREYLAYFYPSIICLVSLGFVLARFDQFDSLIIDLLDSGLNLFIFALLFSFSLVTVWYVPYFLYFSDAVYENLKLNDEVIPGNKRGSKKKYYQHLFKSFVQLHPGEKDAYKKMIALLDDPESNSMQNAFHDVRRILAIIYIIVLVYVVGQTIGNVYHMPFLSTIILVCFLALAGWYFWAYRKTMKSKPETGDCIELNRTERVLVFLANKKLNYVSNFYFFFADRIYRFLFWVIDGKNKLISRIFRKKKTGERTSIGEEPAQSIDKKDAPTPEPSTVGTSTDPGLESPADEEKEKNVLRSKTQIFFTLWVANSAIILLAGMILFCYFKLASWRLQLWLLLIFIFLYSLTFFGSAFYRRFSRRNEFLETSGALNELMSTLNEKLTSGLLAGNFVLAFIGIVVFGAFFFFDGLLSSRFMSDFNPLNVYLLIVNGLIVALAVYERYLQLLSHHLKKIGIWEKGYASPKGKAVAIFAVFVAMAFYFNRKGNHYHTINYVPEVKAEASSVKTFEAYTQLYLDRDPEKQPVIFIASDGGGLKAAYWTLLLLKDLDDRDVFDQVFLMTGASGGGIGQGMYTYFKAQNFSSTQIDTMIEILGETNFLSSDLAGLITRFPAEYIPDFIPFYKWSRKEDRMEAMTRHYFQLTNEKSEYSYPRLEENGFSLSLGAR